MTTGVTTDEFELTHFSAPLATINLNAPDAQTTNTTLITAAERGTTLTDVERPFNLETYFACFVSTLPTSEPLTIASISPSKITTNYGNDLLS